MGKTKAIGEDIGHYNGVCNFRMFYASNPFLDNIINHEPEIKNIKINENKMEENLKRKFRDSKMDVIFQGNFKIVLKEEQNNYFV